MNTRKKLAALLGASALVFALAGTASAAGPGNNGLDATGNGTKSNATVGGSLSDAGNSATMNQDAIMLCDGDNVGSLSGSFTLSKDLDVGSKITVYLVPNNGSDANPPGNVNKNETTITLDAGNHTSGSTIDWSISITSAFTETQGGILAVFAVNDDGTTAISSSKSNSLNCTESQSSSSSSESSSSSSSDSSSSSSSDSSSSSSSESSSSSSSDSSSSSSSESSTTSFTSSEEGSTTSSAETSFTSSEEGSTTTTLPNTATVGGGNTSGPSGNMWLLVAAFGMVLGSVIVMAPALAKTKR